MLRALVMSMILVGISSGLAAAHDRASRNPSDPILIRTCTDDFKRCEVIISDRMMPMPATAIFQPNPEQGVSNEVTSSVRRDKARPTEAGKEPLMPPNRRGDF